MSIPSAAMADVAMLLLIFFLTTTYFQAEAGLEVALPEATQGEDRGADGSWTLHLVEDGTLYLDGRAVRPDEASALLREARRGGRVDRVFLYADRRLPFGQVYPVLAGLRGPESLAVLLIAEPEPEAAGAAPGPDTEENTP